MMKHLLSIFIFLVCFFTANATTYYYISGSLTTLSNWKTTRTGVGGTSPANYTTANDSFKIQTGQSANNGGTWNFGGTGTVLAIESGGTLTAGATLNINPSSFFRIDDGGTYVHNTTNNSSFLGTESFAPTSLVKVNKWASATPVTTNITLPYGHLEIDLLSSVSNWNQAWSTSFTLCTGNLTLTNLGSNFSCVLASNANVTIGGNFSIASTTFDFSTGTGSCNLLIGGNFSQTGGIINVSSTTGGQGTFTFNKIGVQTFTRSGVGTFAAKPIHFIIDSTSILDMVNASVIDGTTGNFTMINRAGLMMSMSPGISASPALTGHIRNTGLRTIGFCYFTYKGTTAQATGDGLPSIMAGLAVNNSSGFSFTNSTNTVKDSISLLTGRITTDATHNLTLGDTCSIFSTTNIYGDANQGTQTSYISGPITVSRNATTLFIIPIGKDTSTGSFFAPVRINPSSSTAQNFVAEYFPKAHNNYTNRDAGTVHHVSDLEHWTINSSLVNSTALVGLSWRPSSDVGISGTTSATDSIRTWDSLVVAHYLNKPPYIWSRDGSPVQLNDSIRPGSTLNYGYITSRFNNAIDSSFTLGTRSPLSILPLKIIQWNAGKENSIIKLNWLTVNEENVKLYELQKSKNGTDFHSIELIMPLKGSQENKYAKIDYSPYSGINYFRLMIRDKENKITYSKVLSVSFLQSQQLSVYPDPAINRISVDHRSFLSAMVYRISSLKGEILKEGIVQQGHTKTEVNVSELPPGIYYFQIGGGRNQQSISFIKM